MTSPDKYMPDTAINAAPGFAAYAGTSQEDWEEQMNDQWVGLSGPLSGVCELLYMMPCMDGLMNLGNPEGFPITGNTGGLIQGSQNFADGLCQIHNDITGESYGGGTTPQMVTEKVQGATDAVMSTPFTSGIVEMGQAGGTSGNAAIDANQGAQEFANQLYATTNPCGCGPQYAPTGAGGVTPTTIINTAQDTADTVAASPFAMGILDMGQQSGSEPSPSGNIGSDAIAGGQAFADGLFGALCGGCGSSINSQTATPQDVIGQAQTVADAYNASPMATGLVAMGQEPAPSGNPAADAIAGGQAAADSIFNIFQLCGCGNETNPQTATPQDIIGAAQDTAAVAGSTPITASILAIGQSDGSSGNVATDSVNGLQAFVNAICGTTGNTANGDTSATDIAVGAANVSNAVQSTPFTAGLMDMSTDDSNGHAGNLLSGLQNFLDNLCGLSTATPGTGPMAGEGAPVYGSATPATILDRLGALNNSVQANPYYNQAMAYIPDPSGQTETDTLDAATAWAAEYYALQGVENPAYHVVDPSLTPVFSVSALTADAPSQIDVTAAGGTAIGFVYMVSQQLKNSVAWIGYGKTSITDVTVRIYTVDPALAHLDLLWTSPNVVSSVPDTLDWIYVPLEMSIETQVGDWFALEVQITGSGTHHMVGMPNHWLESNTKTFPQKLAATRPNAQDPATPFAPTYSPNVPWLAMSSALAVQTLEMSAAIPTAVSVPTATLAQTSPALFPYTFPITLPTGYAVPAALPLPVDWAASRGFSFVWQDNLAAEVNLIGAGTLIPPRRQVTDAGATLTLSVAYNVYEHTGTGATWTLPALSGNTGRGWTLIHRGSGTLTVVRAGTNQIYSAGALVTSLTLTPGRTYELVSDGTYWIAIAT